MELDLALLTVGGLVLVLGLLSGWLRHTILGEPLIALALGVLLGPLVTGLLDLSRWGDPDRILFEATRVTLAISLMAVALRLNRRRLHRNRRALATLLGLLMPAMWLASAALVLVILGVPAPLAAIIGAAITPTDPVVATSIMTGKVAETNLPPRVRHTLTAESGANDGLAMPFLALAVVWSEGGRAGALADWLLGGVLLGVGGAALFGLVVGHTAGRLLEWALARKEIEKTSRLAYTVALSLVVLGGASLLHLNEILAVFVTGLSFDNAVRERDRVEEEAVQEGINRFFMLPIFALLGMALPWREWGELAWKGPLLAVAILGLRRVPAVLLLRPLLGRVRGWNDALFIGWFGPIGVAALYYALHAKEQLGDGLPWTVVTLVVVASILVHGVSATPLTRLYGRRGGRHHHEADEDPS
jgi:sodium/hydrogen antiporter